MSHQGSLSSYYVPAFTWITFINLNNFFKFHWPEERQRLRSLMTILVAQPSLKGPWVSVAQGGDPAVPSSPQLFSFWWIRWKRIRLQCRRPVFDPWVGKIPWKREWQPTSVFLPGEFQGQRSLAG